MLTPGTFKASALIAGQLHHLTGGDSDFPLIVLKSPANQTWYLDQRPFLFLSAAEILYCSDG